MKSHITQTGKELIATIIVSLAEKRRKDELRPSIHRSFFRFKKQCLSQTLWLWQIGKGEEGIIGDFTVNPKEDISTNLKKNYILRQSYIKFMIQNSRTA
jgi:hypothetical protein